MASGRSGGYIMSKQPPPSPGSPGKQTVGGFKQKRVEGMTPEGAEIITGKQQEIGPLEDWDHAGSGKRYMAYKNAKLQQQFQQNASRLNAAEGNVKDANLFRGISIFVNGLTSPSQLELKHLMAQHGGTFINYYSRSSVTHIICSNLTDAKVKIFEKERNPTPIVRPEWIVDSLAAHKLLPSENYILNRLRGQPGQKLLAGFRTLEADALSPEKLYKSDVRPDHPGAAADLASQPPPPLPQPQPQPQPQQAQAQAQQQQTIDTAAAAAQTSEVANAVPSLQDEPSLDSWRADTTEQQREGQPAAVVASDAAPQLDLPAPFALAQEGATSSQHSDVVALLTPIEAELPQVVAPSSSATLSQSAELPAGIEVPPQAEGDAAAADNVSEQHIQMTGNAQASAEQDANGSSRTAGQQAQQAVTASLSAAQHSMRGRPAIHSTAVADDMALAQQIAAKKRAVCDVLKGAPRSSHEDPQFMETFFKASRLHFIGTWKARIEALMAASEEAPQPVQAQPSVLSALKGKQKATARCIIHMDMDCFFASIATLGHPSFAGKPLCVSHSNSSVGTAEVSSANYEARAFGIRAGMMMSRAKQLCPQLLVLPYEFDKYEEASEAVYEILLAHTAAVQPISCDEAYLDVSGLGDPVAIAEHMRAQIKTATGCTASAGIGSNMLIARLATKRAKPDGVFRIANNEAQAAIAALPLSELPGVGWSLQKRLSELGLTTCADVRLSTKERLQRELGEKSGASLWDMSHGRDKRAVQPPQPRRSVGAEVNWGIRFREQKEADVFLLELAGEVSSRLTEAGVKGRCVTLKVKRRKEGAPEPSKFMGHGVCDNLSRSITLADFVDARSDIAAAAQQVMRALQMPPMDMRGIGITVSKLDSDPASGAAKPTTTAVAKLRAPKASVFDPAEHPWAAVLQQAADDEATAKQAQQAKQPRVPPWADAGPPVGRSPPEKAQPQADSAQLLRSSGPLDQLLAGVWASNAASAPSVEQLAEASSSALQEAAEDAAQPFGSPIDPQQQDRSGAGADGSADAPAADAGPLDPLPGFLQQALHGAGSGDDAMAADVAADVATADFAAEPPLVDTDSEDDREYAPTQDSPRPKRRRTADPAATAALGGFVGLPPVSQLDTAVMDALPPILKRELELAYGIAEAQPPQQRQSRVHWAADEQLSKPRQPARRAAPANLEAELMDAEEAAVVAQWPADVQQEVRRQLLAPPLQLLGEGFDTAEAAAADETVTDDLQDRQEEQQQQQEGPRYEPPPKPAWGLLPWLQQRDIIEAAEKETAAAMAHRTADWAEDVRDAAPEAVLDYLQNSSAADGCCLMREWAEDGLRNLMFSEPVAACSCDAVAAVMCERHAVWQKLTESWAASFLVASNLEGLQLALRCIAGLGEQHGHLAAVAELTVARMQAAVMQLHGCPLQLRGVLD